MITSQPPPQHDAVRREYDRLAASYDRRWETYINATLDAAVDAVELGGQEQLLDVPCGTGELAVRLLDRWPHVQITGVDLSAGMLQVAKEKNSHHRIAWAQSDACALPFPDSCFDYVICANSFHYFSHPRQALQEFHRVLRPGGHLVLLDWCDDFLTCRLCSLWLRWTDAAFHRTYSLEGCRNMLTQAGFRISSADRIRVSWLWGLMRFVCQRGE